MKVKGLSGREYELYYFDKDKKVIVQTFPEVLSQKDIFEFENQLLDLGININNILKDKWKVYVVAREIYDDKEFETSTGELLRRRGYTFIEKDPKDPSVEYTARKLLYIKGLL